ncbi:MAG: TRAP transporter fused permease subunit [Spirochaetaceae bacterium]|nr:TRAP transporter fused permease subunit [Spirochaetaceae bacterium]
MNQETIQETGQEEIYQKKVKIPEERVNIYDENDIQGLTIGNLTVRKIIIFTIGFLAAGIPIYEIIFGPLLPDYQRPLHLFLMISLTLLLYPSGFIKNKKVESIMNITLVLAMGFVCAWASSRWTFFYATPHPEPHEPIFGVIMILLTFEATRRAIGPAMAIIGSCFIAYCFIGPWMPRYFAHPGYHPTELVTHLIVGVEGMLGELMAISATQIVFFMMFASFLKMTKSTTVFMNLSQSLAGHRAGGPAKVSVVSTAFVSMFTGSASGNVATTGSVTIPLMIKLGFKKHVAAAIEATASTAGQFSPPIMGAAAFVIAEYTMNSYWTICKAAFLPSLAYFAIMFLVVGILAKRDNLLGLPKDQLPPVKSSVISALPILIPMTVLITLLAMQMSIQFTIIIALGTLIITCIPIKEQRIGFVKICKAISNTAKILIPITASCSVAGLIVGVMTLTGFGERLSYGIILFADGNLFLGLVLTAIVCLAIGLGLPTLGAYVVLAALGAPALVTLGADLLAAHMFIFYFAILTAITPPVCLSAFVAASIARTNPFKVAFTSMKLAPFIYVLPFLFVYDINLLLLGDSLIGTLYSILKAATILTMVTIVFQGYFFTKMKIWEFILLIAALLFYIWSQIFPILALVFVVFFVSQFIRNKHKAISKKGAN